MIAVRGVNDANPWLSIFAFGGLASAVAAGVSATIAIIRARERGLLLVLPALLGIVTIAFLIGEFVAPH